MKSRAAVVAIVVAATTLAACGSPSAPSDEHVFTFDFARSAEGWTSGFCDFPVGWEPQMELVAEHRGLPSPLDQGGGGLYIAGNNHSDDLFMFWKGRVGGLQPGGTYSVDISIQFATNIPKGVGGIGGSPDTSVFVKVGGSSTEPVVVAVDAAGRREYNLSIDKGNQSQSGKGAVVIGTAGNLSGTATWELKELKSGPSRLSLTAAPDGSAWLLVGTDSGFEGPTALYYTRVGAQFVPQ